MKIGRDTFLRISPSACWRFLRAREETSRQRLVFCSLYRQTAKEVPVSPVDQLGRRYRAYLFASAIFTDLPNMVKHGPTWSFAQWTSLAAHWMQSFAYNIGSTKAFVWSSQVCLELRVRLVWRRMDFFSSTDVLENDLKFANRRWNIRLHSWLTVSQACRQRSSVSLSYLEIRCERFICRCLEQAVLTSCFKNELRRLQPRSNRD